MDGYRCYFLNEDGHVRSREDIESERFGEAVDVALTLLRQRPHYRSVEIWQGAVRLYASGEQPARHQCHVYEGAPSQTLKSMALLIDQKIKDNIRCLYINSPPMIAGLRSYLSAIDVDVAHQVAIGALILSSDQSHLEGGRFNAARLLAALEGAVDEALSAGYDALWATGDMTWELGSHRDPEELLKYEWGLEEVFRRRPQLTGICQYHLDTLPRDLVAYGLAAHRTIFINETLSRLNSYYLEPFSETVPDAQLSDTIHELCNTGEPAE